MRGAVDRDVVSTQRLRDSLASRKRVGPDTHRASSVGENVASDTGTRQVRKPVARVASKLLRASSVRDDVANDARVACNHDVDANTSRVPNIEHAPIVEVDGSATLDDERFTRRDDDVSHSGVDACGCAVDGHANGGGDLQRVVAANEEHTRRAIARWVPVDGANRERGGDGERGIPEDGDGIAWRVHVGHAHPDHAVLERLAIKSGPDVKRWCDDVGAHSRCSLPDCSAARRKRSPTFGSRERLTALA